MLERPGLWLSAPTNAGPLPGPTTGGHVRLVLDALSREMVGHVVIFPRSWWPWRRGRRFVAYEAPDASLVFAGRILGWPEWTTTVQDADDHLVALVRDTYVLTPIGGLLAYHEPAPGGHSGSFRGPDGQEVAQWQTEGVGTRLQFRPVVQEEPFTKMGLLAAVLASGDASAKPR